MSTELVSVFLGGAAIVAWGLRLGVSPALMAMLLALPIVAQVLQLPGAIVARSLGHRPTVVVATLLSRAALIPLAVFSALPVSASQARVLLASVSIIHHGFTAITAGARTDWLGEAVPASFRGQYLGTRERTVALLGSLASFVVGLALRGGAHDGNAARALERLAAAATVLGIASVACHWLQPARAPNLVGDATPALTHLVHCRDARAALYLAVGWHAACGLSAPFFGLYLLNDLHLGFGAIASYAGAFAVARVLSAPVWGRITDARGARNVLLACTAGLALSPLCWLSCEPGRNWPLAVDALLGGALFGGHTISTTALQLSSAPRRGRLFHLATIAGCAGAAFALTAVAGALVAAAAPTASVRPQLAVSALLRGVTVVITLRRGADRRYVVRAAPPDAAPATAARRAA